MQKLFELAFVLLFLVYCVWRVARPICSILTVLADEAAREDRRRLQRTSDDRGESETE